MRTEHQLRMAFDPEYAEKYEELRASRSRLIGLYKKAFLNHWTLAINAITMSLHFFIYFAYYEVKIKKRLNLPLFLL